MVSLDAPITELSGAGPKTAQYLAKRGIRSIEDLLYFCPASYRDRRTIKTIEGITEEGQVQFVGRVVSAAPALYRTTSRRGYQALLEDDTGRITLIWFRRLPFLNTLCRRGNLLFVSGKASRYRGGLQMIHPDISLVEDSDEADGLLVVEPVYPEVEGIKQGNLRKLVATAFEGCGPSIRSYIPLEVEKSGGITLLGDALRSIHFPEEGLVLGERTPSLERLILEEFFLFQYALLIRRGQIKKEKGIPFVPKEARHRRLMEGLPFSLTEAQERVLGEIEADMRAAEPMNRLLQGDVGSGKTICAAYAACLAVDSGFQAAFMAPTEILAEQHYGTLDRIFAGSGIESALLTGSSNAHKRDILEAIASGAVSVVVGTHALLQERVRFRKLGLVIIDEQQRFGVIQRKMLRQKGLNPDVLIMTATPIPRTLCMAVYGDLDVSIIDEMPKGRQPVRTKVFAEKERGMVYGLIGESLRDGRQVYMVYPLVDESDRMELRNATDMAEHLQKEIFPDHTIALLHGRMKTEEKEKVMEGFKSRATDMLVATTVIEVGIDVPNAAVIAVEHAERFGLSQLHQLRGRVGRAEFASSCFLIASGKRTQAAAKRLRVMEETTDGFRIAEEDMRLRGPGEMLGVRQAGLPNFRIGDIVRDGDIMTRARKMAQEAFLQGKPEETQKTKEAALARWGKRLELYEVS